MRRHTSIFLGWPTDILGPLNGVDSSSKNENFVVVLFEGMEAEHGFLVFQFEKIAEISRRWLMGEDADVIDREVLSK